MKENEEIKKAADEEDDLNICTITDDDEKLVQEKKKVSSDIDVKFKSPDAHLLPSVQEASMMCTIHRQYFYTFAKKSWIGDSGTS